MSTIEFFTCNKGHKYLRMKTCPFCCALDGKEPVDENEMFYGIFNSIKGRSTEEIEKFYKEFSFVIEYGDHDRSLINHYDLFRG